MVIAASTGIVGASTVLLAGRSRTAFNVATYIFVSCLFRKHFKFIKQRVIQMTVSFFLVYLIRIFIASLHSYK